MSVKKMNAEDLSNNIRYCELKEDAEDGKGANNSNFLEH